MAIRELVKFRAQYPEYDDLSDREIADKLAAKYPEYEDLPSRVRKDIGLTQGWGALAPTERATTVESLRKDRPSMVRALEEEVRYSPFDPGIDKSIPARAWETAVKPARL